MTGAALPTAQRSAENGPETSQQSTATEQETEQHEIPTQRQLATAGKVRWQGPEGVGLARAKRGRQLGRSGPGGLQGLPRDKGLRSGRARAAGNWDCSGRRVDTCSRWLAYRPGLSLEGPCY